jgi:hypothetical protein
MGLGTAGPARGVIVALLVLAFWIGTPITLHGTTRPDPTGPLPGVQRWPAPVVTTDPISTPILQRWSGLPMRLPAHEPALEFVVEQQIIDAYGLDVVEETAERWSAVTGSALRLTIDGVVDEQVAVNTIDGVNRVFLMDRGCHDGRVGQAFVHAGTIDRRFHREAAYITEVDIGLCPGLEQDAARRVLLHEFGHAAGFGHLCDPDDRHGCWTPEMGEGNRCRVMYVAAASCQSWERIDDEAVVRHYPVLPRITGPDPVATASHVSFAIAVQDWDAPVVVVVDPGAGERLRWSAVAAAGALRAPLLLAPSDPAGCVEGALVDELSRVAEHGAEVLLAGPRAARCAADIDRLNLRSRALISAPDILQLMDERLGRLDGVVVAGAEVDGTVPNGAVAAAAAGRAGVPLVFAGRHLDNAAQRWLEERPHIRRALVVGDHEILRYPVVGALRHDHGLEVQRIAAASIGAASTEVMAVEGWSGRRSLVASGPGDDALIAAGAAGRTGADLLVTGAGALPAGTRGTVAGRLSEGFVVGADLESAQHTALARWLDDR